MENGTTLTCLQARLRAVRESHPRPLFLFYILAKLLFHVKVTLLT